MQSQEATTSRRFNFVELLARELSAGHPEVPGFPDIVVRIRRALDDANCNVNTVAKIISGEPVLTAKLIRMANSAALRPATGQIKDPRNAVARLGFTMVQSATFAFATEQMKIAHRYEAVKDQFAQIWQRSTHVAAISYVLTRRCTSLNADEAMLAGLVHAIGKIYILSRAEDYPDLFESQSELESVMSDWHVSTGQAVLQGWDFPAEIVDAVAGQNDRDTEPSNGPALADVLVVAVPLAPVLNLDGDIESCLEETRAAMRLGLARNTCVDIIREAREQIEDLRAALGTS
jgi:HD-like signal output (HDOD) protein